MAARTKKVKSRQMDLLGDAEVWVEKKLRQHLTQDEKYSKEQGRGQVILAQAEKLYPGQPLRQINHFFDKFVIPAGTGRARTVGEKTVKAYRSRLTRVVKTLALLNIRVQNLSDLTSKQVRLAMEEWEAKKMSASVLANRNTVVRRFGSWIGKPDLAPYPQEHVKDPGNVRRRQSAEYSKSWESHGIDPEEVIALIAQDCPATGLHLHLQHKFGLRPEESLCFCPIESDCGGTIELSKGTKGGRVRVVPVETAAQRDLLETAKLFVRQAMESERSRGLTVGLGYIAAKPGAKLHQATNHFNHMMRKYEVTMKGLGVTAHGLRHSYAQERFRRITGELAPVAGGKKINHAFEVAARLEITEALGHGRETATAAYLGTHQHLSRVAAANLRNLNSKLRSSSALTSLCQQVGVTNITVLGEAADGKTIVPGRDVLCVLDKPAEGQERAIQDLLSGLTGWRVFVTSQACIASDTPTFEIEMKPLDPVGGSQHDQAHAALRGEQPLTVVDRPQNSI